MSKLPLTSLFLILTLFFAPFVMAEDEVTENLKERLKSAVAGADINQATTQSLKGYVGVVSDIIQNTIVLEDKEGKKSIKVDDDTTIIRNPGNKEIELESVRIDDSIIAIGDTLTDDEILGKRLIVSISDLNPPEKLSGLGTITEINKYSYTLTKPNSDESLELFFTKKTIYKSPTELLQSENLAVGDEVLYTAVKDKDDDWSATIIMRVSPAPTPSPVD